MSKYYIANANGDWWTMEKGEGDTLYIITEEYLKHVNDGEEPSEIDDLSGLIITHGIPAHPYIDIEDIK